MVPEYKPAADILTVIRRALEGDQLSVGEACPERSRREVLGGARTNGGFVIAAGIVGDVPANHIAHRVVLEVNRGDGRGDGGVIGMDREVGGDAHVGSITYIVEGKKRSSLSCTSRKTTDP